MFCFFSHPVFGSHFSPMFGFLFQLVLGFFSLMLFVVNGVKDTSSGMSRAAVRCSEVPTA